LPKEGKELNTTIPYPTDLFLFFHPKEVKKMLTYTTKEGKTIYLAELCWFEGINTPFLRTDKNHYLATTEKEDLPFPQIRVLYVEERRKGKNLKKSFS